MVKKFLNSLVMFTLVVCIIGILVSLYNIVTFDNLQELGRVSYPMQHLFEMGVFTGVLFLATIVKNDI